MAFSCEWPFFFDFIQWHSMGWLLFRGAQFQTHAQSRVIQVLAVETVDSQRGELISFVAAVPIWNWHWRWFTVDCHA
jgi:hypothetical protein